MPGSARPTDLVSRQWPPVMILSASVLLEDRDAALRSDADRFRSKPHRPSKLIAAVTDLLELRSAS